MYVPRRCNQMDIGFFPYEGVCVCLSLVLVCVCVCLHRYFVLTDCTAHFLFILGYAAPWDEFGVDRTNTVYTITAN